MKNTDKWKTPLEAMRINCIECSGGSYKNVRLCPIEECTLYPYRFGRNPRRARNGDVNGNHNPID